MLFDHVREGFKNKKKIIEFSIKDLPHPPLIEKNNKQDRTFFKVKLYSEE